MAENETRRMTSVGPDPGFVTFQEHNRAKLVVVSGGLAGVEFAINRPRVVLGRGPDVDLEFRVATMSRQHAAIEFRDGGFRIEDLGSTNGVTVNGTRVEVQALTHGDRIELGDQAFQLLVESVEDEPGVYELPEDP